MNQLTVIMIGLAMGGIARWLLLRQAPGGLPMALLLGTAGAMFAAFLAHELGLPRDHESQRLAVSALGAAILLLGYRLDLSRESPRSTPSHDLNLHR